MSSAALAVLAVALVAGCWINVWVKINVKSGYDKVVFVVCVAMSVAVLYLAWRLPEVRP